MAHARRKFFDLNAAQANAIAQEALNRLAALYEIEQRGKLLSIAERTALRQTEAQPLLEAMHVWLKATRMTVSVLTIAARVIASPALMRKISNPLAYLHRLRSQAAAVINASPVPS